MSGLQRTSCLIPAESSSATNWKSSALLEQNERHVEVTMRTRAAARRAVLLVQAIALIILGILATPGQLTEANDSVPALTDSDYTSRPRIHMFTHSVWTASENGGTESLVAARRDQLVDSLADNRSAPPALPCSLWGIAQMNGANVPDGTIVSAWIGDVQVAETTTVTYGGTSVYALDVPGDDPNTPEVEGGVEGDTIALKVGSLRAGPTATWYSGTGVHHDIEVVWEPSSSLHLPLVLKP